MCLDYLVKLGCEGQREESVEYDLRVSGLMVPGKDFCNSSLHSVFLSLGSRRKTNTSSEISPKKVKWLSCTSSPPSSLLSEGNSSESEVTLSTCEKPKGESYARYGEKEGHLTMFEASCLCSGITYACLDPPPRIPPYLPAAGSPSSPSLRGQR